MTVAKKVARVAREKGKVAKKVAKSRSYTRKEWV